MTITAIENARASRTVGRASQGAWLGDFLSSPDSWRPILTLVSPKNFAAKPDTRSMDQTSASRLSTCCPTSKPSWRRMGVTSRTW